MRITIRNKSVKNMFILITGGSKSGKSLMAENIISEYEGKKYYIATMEPFTADAKEAISRHRKMRRGKEFETVEKYKDIEEADIPDGSVVLLECMGNLCANEMFSGQYKSDVAEKIVTGIRKLADRQKLMIVVTNQVGEDGITYADETMEYIRNLGMINSALSKYADVVIESVYGIPLVLKEKRNGE